MPRSNGLLQLLLKSGPTMEFENVLGHQVSAEIMSDSESVPGKTYVTVDVTILTIDQSAGVPFQRTILRTFEGKNGKKAATVFGNEYPRWISRKVNKIVKGVVNAYNKGENLADYDIEK